MASCAVRYSVVAGQGCGEITGCAGMRAPAAGRVSCGRERQANRAVIGAKKFGRERGETRRGVRVRAEGKVVEGSEAETEKQKVAAVTVGIVAPEVSTAAIDAAVAAAADADSAAVGRRNVGRKHK